jgi:hypothetical protein
MWLEFESWLGLAHPCISIIIMFTWIDFFMWSKGEWSVSELDRIQIPEYHWFIVEIQWFYDTFAKHLKWTSIIIQFDDFVLINNDINVIHLFTAI